MEVACQQDPEMSAIIKNACQPLLTWTAWHWYHMVCGMLHICARLLHAYRRVCVRENIFWFISGSLLNVLIGVQSDKINELLTVFTLYVVCMLPHQPVPYHALFHR